MAESPQNPTDLGYYAMMQIGVEMAAPVALGYWGDSFWGCFPWLTAVGAVLGLVFGLVAVTRVGRDNSLDERKPQLPEDGK